MKVVVGDPGFSLERVRELLDGLTVEVVRGGEPWSGDDVVALLVGTDVAVREDDLDRLPALRVVATCSVGFDHVAYEEATGRGVWVCNVPDYCIDEVADHSLALVLALLRGVVELDRVVRDGRWDWKAAGPLRRVRGTRLGIVGFGRIGRALAERGLALGFEVWASDPAIPADDIAAAGVRPASLPELLESCDAVSLHLPLMPETAGLLGEEELARMPAGAVLVDTARAELVDLDALLDALAGGRRGGAALDVLGVEPPTADDPAPRASRLVVTPHAAWYSAEAEEAVYRRPVLSVRAVLEGREPDGAVNRP
ncbi:MAG TPA: C-terminal binding protein [Gaiellaceae bacterium]|nr:C-terminal binding protein [Gaiellaceae bacterium]